MADRVAHTVRETCPACGQRVWAEASVLVIGPRGGSYQLRCPSCGNERTETVVLEPLEPRGAEASDA